MLQKKYVKIIEYLLQSIMFKCYRQENNFEAFRERVKACVKDSVNQVFNPSTMDDPHYIIFSQYVSEQYDTVKREIYEPTKVKYSSQLKNTQN